MLVQLSRASKTYPTGLGTLPAVIFELGALLGELVQDIEQIAR
jgi:hypothetical protein